MSVQVMSRILLSTLCVAACTWGVFFAIGGYYVYALILIAIGVGVLLWLWKPWRLLRRQV
jgi:heme exporter protein D